MRSIAAIALALVLAVPASANTINFKGFDFTSFYGPEVLVINGAGNLETPTAPVGGFFGGGIHVTSAAFRAGAHQNVRAATDEVGAGNYAVSQLWIQDFTGGLLYEAMFGTFVGGGEGSFLIQTRVRDGGGAILDLDNYVLGPRTAGSHSFGVKKTPTGDVHWLLDDALVLTTTAADWAIGEIDTVLLFAQGTTSEQISTWTDVKIDNVPEPSVLALLGLGLAGLGFGRRKA